MTPERWEHIQGIYHKTRELEENERALFLERVCAGDASLRDEVLSLIAAGKEMGDSFLEAKTLNAPAREAAAVHDQSSLLPSANSFIGLQLGNYQILSPLGAGGMGEVFLAHDARLDRKVAIKILPAEFTRDTGRLERFEREARAASALNHPNILTIYEIGSAKLEFGEIHFIATEFIEGHTLRKMMASPLGISETLDIAIQATSALSVAHQAGIIHRDIKPENLMMRPDRVVKVLDFGLAKLNASQPDSLDSEAATLQIGAKTAPGMILGTLRYMSPEQARGLPVDARSDVFSLGVLMYEMIAGHAPFSGETTSDVIVSILTTEPPPLLSIRPETPPELQRIIGKTLRKNKDERYQTCKDLLVDLKDLKSEREFSAKLERTTGSVKANHTGETQPQTPAAAISPHQISLRQILMSLPVAVLLIAAGWWFFAGNHETVSPASLKSVEITSWASSPGELYSVGTFSPDGQTIAFVSTRSGSKNIWVKRTASGEAIQVTKDEFANENPIWSPNGDEIAYFSIRGGHPGIWRTPVFGGTPALLSTLQDGDVRLRRWSKDGAKIYYELKRNLFAMDVKSGQTTQITNLDPANLNSDSLNISPDEQRVAYISTTQDGRSNVWVAPISAGSPRQIASDMGYDRNIAWHPDSKRIFYSANVEGVYQIFLANVDGQKSVPVTNGDVNSFVLDVSPDGARILYGSTQEESDVWKVDVADGTETALTSDLGSELWPEVSPDGKTIAYQAVRNLSQGDKIYNCSILLRQNSADEPMRLADDGALPTWSPNGTQIAFMRLIGDVQSLWLTRAAGDQGKQLVAGGLTPVENTLLPYLRVQTSSFSWSPDGKKIAYISDKNDLQNLWTIAADGSGETQITRNTDPGLSFNCPLWSADGSQIAYSSKPDISSPKEKIIHSIWLTDEGNKTSKTVIESESFLRLIGWSQEDKGLILATLKGRYSSTRPTEVELVRVTIATGEQRPIATLQAAYLYNVHLSADRKTIAFTSRQDGKDNIWLIPSSGGGAKKLTANNDARLYFSSLSWSPDGRAIYFGKQSRHSLLSMIPNFK
ncbi:MAG: serine/threonine-protein kinase [Acidobacteria bacterium]|nr:serine/threonine-protein kinase [Acidobacteriota bacterium]